MTHPIDSAISTCLLCAAALAKEIELLEELRHIIPTGWWPNIAAVTTETWGPNYRIHLNPEADARAFVLDCAHQFGKGKKGKHWDGSITVTFTYPDTHTTLIIHGYQPPTCRKVTISRPITQTVETRTTWICNEAEAESLRTQGYTINT